jgi:hypothetical protein
MTFKSVALHYYVMILLKKSPKICHFQFISNPFRIPLSSKKINYIVSKKKLDILYSLDSSQTYPNVSIIYWKYFCIYTSNIFKINSISHLETCKIKQWINIM